MLLPTNLETRTSLKQLKLKDTPLSNELIWTFI